MFGPMLLLLLLFKPLKYIVSVIAVNMRSQSGQGGGGRKRYSGGSQQQHMSEPVGLLIMLLLLDADSTLVVADG